LNISTDPFDDYTFFASTNNALSSAFNQIPRLLQLFLFYDDFLPHLNDLLLYHGLEGERFSSQFDNGDTITTLNTERVGFRTTAGTLRVNTVAVVDPNIDAANGVVHKIQGVLSPAWTFNY
jgi:uncharacterized surface protein with fasciclin (FAS1) repeats